VAFCGKGGSGKALSEVTRWFIDNGAKRLGKKHTRKGSGIASNADGETRSPREELGGLKKKEKPMS